jgi:capsular polysaccharide biosynthesis protein
MTDGPSLVGSPMEAVTILRELWRRRVLVALVALAAALVGFLLAYRVGFPPEPRKYEVGLATARVLVDTPQSQVIKVDPKGSDTLGLRASVLANLMVEGEAKDAIARRAGLTPKKLTAVSASATSVDGSGGEPQPVSTAFPDDPDVHMIRTRVIANPDGEQLPIIETDVQAPDAASATKLANATVTGLTDYLDKRAAADGDVDEARRLRISGLGSAQATVAARGPGRGVAAAAAIVIFLAGCAIILLVSALARSWRAAEVSERAETIDSAPDESPSEDFAFDDLSLDLEPVRLTPRRSERDDEARAESA